MGSTLLNSMAACKCYIPEEREDIYTLIINTAEKNIEPVSYHCWPMNTGRKYEIMATLCGMASDIFNGNLHWHGEWGRMGICSEFMTYAENILKRAAETTGPVPNLSEYRLIYFKPDDPCVDLLDHFIKLERFEIHNFFDEKVLQIRNPTISDLYWGERIRQHYETCKKYAVEPGNFDAVKFRKILAEWGCMMPDRYRKAFKTVEEVS